MNIHEANVHYGNRIIVVLNMLLKRVFLVRQSASLSTNDFQSIMLTVNKVLWIEMALALFQSLLSSTSLDPFQEDRCRILQHCTWRKYP